MANNSISILLTWQPRLGDVQQRIISPDEYFDPEDDGSFQVDSVPRETELAAAVSMSAEDLSWISADVMCQTTGARRKHVERYWGEISENRISLLEDLDSTGATDAETVVQICDPDSGNIHTIRFSSPSRDSMGGAVSHGMITGHGEDERVVAILHKTED